MKPSIDKNTLSMTKTCCHSIPDSPSEPQMAGVEKRVAIKSRSTFASHRLVAPSTALIWYYPSFGPCFVIWRMSRYSYPCRFIWPVQFRVILSSQSLNYPILPAPKLCSLVGWSIPVKIMQNAAPAHWPYVNSTPQSKVITKSNLVRHPHCNYDVKLKVADQKYPHGKERSYSKNKYPETVI